MIVYIVLLRGINVSGQKKIKMEDLRKLIESLGFESVQTYIQSGNIIFKSPLTNSSDIGISIKQQINQKYGFEVPVLIRTRERLSKIVKNNPFFDKDLSRVSVLFLSESPFIIPTNEIIKIKDASEEFYISDKEIYLFLPKGAGHTKLTTNFFERKMKVSATARNWNTTTKLLEIANRVL